MLMLSYSLNLIGPMGFRKGRSKKLFRRRNRLDVSKFVISSRVVDSWNFLSEDCTTLNEFKSCIAIKLQTEIKN